VQRLRGARRTTAAASQRSSAAPAAARPAEARASAAAASRVAAISMAQTPRAVAAMPTQPSDDRANAWRMRSPAAPLR
jgi:hypothetical protein